MLVVAGCLAVRNGRLPKALAVLGVSAGVAALVFAVASFLGLPTLTLITAALAVVFPQWLIWTGLVLGQDKP